MRVSEETLLNQLGMQPLRDALLRQALAYYEQFLAERQDDPQLRREVAQAQFFVGRITETVDSPAKALAALRAGGGAAEGVARATASGGERRASARPPSMRKRSTRWAGAAESAAARRSAREHYQQAAELREKLAEDGPGRRGAGPGAGQQRDESGHRGVDLSGQPGDGAAAAGAGAVAAAGARRRSETAAAEAAARHGHGLLQSGAGAVGRWRTLRRPKRNLFEAIGAFEQLAARAAAIWTIGGGWRFAAA